jgi:hypothetical protein
MAQSLADIATFPPHVRFTPKSGHAALQAACPPCDVALGYDAAPIHLIQLSAYSSGVCICLDGGARGRDAMVEIIEILRQEHRNLEKLLRVMEQELSVFDRGERPDYEVFGAII